MKIIGHRGARGLAPENTVAGMQKALEHHVDMIEFDIRCTKDNVLVAVHDRSLNDASGNVLSVADSNYAALKAHKPDLATFQDIVEAVNRRVPLLIEVKDPAAVPTLVSALKHYLQRGWQPSDFMVLSFHFSVLQAIKQALPNIPLMVNERWSGVRARWRADRLGTTNVDLHTLALWTGFIRLVKRSKFQLYTFTLNDVRKGRRWQRAGLAGVITDFPDRFER